MPSSSRPGCSCFAAIVRAPSGEDVRHRGDEGRGPIVAVERFARRGLGEKPRPVRYVRHDVPFPRIARALAGVPRFDRTGALRAKRSVIAAATFLIGVQRGRTFWGIRLVKRPGPRVFPLPALRRLAALVMDLHVFSVPYQRQMWNAMFVQPSGAVGAHRFADANDLQHVAKRPYRAFWILLAGDETLHDGHFGVQPGLHAFGICRGYRASDAFTNLLADGRDVFQAILNTLVRDNQAVAVHQTDG